jgi:putative ABC transport system permease protein
MGILLLGSPGSGTVENAIAVRIRTENVSGTISAVKKVWDRYAQGTPFDYSFLDDDYDNLYRNEMQTEKVFAVFSCLAIAIACLGLLGLSAFAAERRTKEIGVRKVLGASVPNLIGLLSSEFTKWVLLANVIAWPIAYYAMNNWLQNFAYRIPINVWVFLSAGTVALAIALLTVGFQAAKAATANPVESLRYE